MDRSVRNAVALGLGIFLASLLPESVPTLFYLALIVLSFLWTRGARCRHQVLAALLGAASLSASLSGQVQVERHRSTLLDDREAELLVGRIVGPTRTFPGRQQVLLSTESERIWLTVYSEDGPLNATLPRLLLPGQELEVMARLRRPIGLRGLGTVNRRYQIMALGASILGTARARDVRVRSTHFSPWRSAMAWQQRAVRTIQGQGGSPEGKAIVAALAAGERSAMSDSLLSAVRASGLAHLLAVSGMHMAAVVALIYFLVIRLWCRSSLCLRVEPKAAAAALALLGALFFTALTGARPSTCRAFLVAALVLVGVLLDRRMRPLCALGFAAQILLLWRPVLLWDVGFQMSFAATFALAWVFSQDERPLQFSSRSHWRRWGGFLAGLVRASFWASLATAPIALYHFGQVSLVAVFSNLLAVPLVTLVVLPLALIGVALSALCPWLGSFVLWPCITICDWLAKACYALEAHLPLAIRAPLSLWELLLWGLGTGLLLTARRPISSHWYLRSRTRVAALALLMALFALSRHHGALTPSFVRITFLEIGQGDATLVELPDGQVWLVDGGGLPFVAPSAFRDSQSIAQSPARQALLPLLRHRRIDHIDLAIVSHAHPDHYIGLQAVAQIMPIRELWSAHEPAEGTRQGPYERWLDVLRAQGTLVIAPRLGVARSGGGVSLEVLWPVYSEEEEPLVHRPARSDPILSINDNSLVVRLQVAGRSVLFAGDVESETEELLVERYGQHLHSDVLKVPHHGSKTSSSSRFAKVIRPAIAIISCGLANRFGFPNKEVEERWQRVSSQLFRTDQVGSITIEIDSDGSLRARTAWPF